MTYECVRPLARGEDHNGDVMNRQVGPSGSHSLMLCRACWDRIMAEPGQRRATEPPKRPGRYDRE